MDTDNIPDTFELLYLKASRERDALKTVNAELLEALDGVLAHLWDGRKRDVKKDYSLMVAEVAARDAIAKAQEEG